jgi:ribulose-phosphate 3-epimerase
VQGNQVKGEVMIIPALLTSDIKVAQDRIDLAQRMSGWIHIDVLDGSLYPYESLSMTALSTLSWQGLQLEVHCMTDDPMSIVESGLAVDRLILHYELPNWQSFYEPLLEEGCNVWLAVAPDTDIEGLHLPADVSGVVFMGVIPGKTGQQLRSDTFDRLDMFRELYPEMPLIIDGGVTAETIRSFLAYGADSFVAGSAIFNAHEPVEAYNELVAMSDLLYTGGTSGDNPAA